MPPLQFTLYLSLLGGVYFGQICCFQNQSTNRKNKILVQNYIGCLISISLLYCREWEIDQLLQFCRRNFIFLIFAWFFKVKYSTKICPSQKDQLYFKMERRRSRPSTLLYIYPFQEGHILVEYFALKNQAKIKKMELRLQNCSSWSISHS